MGKVYIIGTGRQGAIVTEILMITEKEIGGFFDDNKNGNFLGFPILGKTSDLERILNKDDEFIVGIGSCQDRERIYEKYKGKFKMASAIHPSLIKMPSSLIGEGVTIHPGVVIETGAKIGNGVILNTGCIIEHDNVIGDYVALCPGVALSGEVNVGSGTFIGTGTTVRNLINIGHHSYIGVGSNIVTDIPNNVLVYGNPAKVIKKNPFL